MPRRPPRPKTPPPSSFVTKRFGVSMSESRAFARGVTAGKSREVLNLAEPRDFKRGFKFGRRIRIQAIRQRAKDIRRVRVRRTRV